METDSIVTKMIGVVIAIITVAVILIPIVSGVSDNLTDNKSNADNLSHYQVALEDSAEMNVIVEYNETTERWAIDGIDVYAGASFIVSDNLIVILSQAYGVNFRGISDGTAAYIGNNVWADGTTTSTGYYTFNIAITDGAVTVSAVDTELTPVVYDYSYIAYSKNDGDHSLYYGTPANRDYYLNSIDDLVTAIANNSKVIVMTRGEILNSYAPAGTVSDTFTYSLTDVEGTEGQVKVINYNDFYTDFTTVGESTTQVHPNVVIVPTKVFYTLQNNAMVQTLLSIIPIFVVLGILMGIVGMFYMRGKQNQ